MSLSSALSFTLSIIQQSNNVLNRPERGQISKYDTTQTPGSGLVGVAAREG
jgi:hypothetical protein